MGLSEEVVDQASGAFAAASPKLAKRGIAQNFIHGVIT
jgi:hypothetical protein